MEVEGAYNSGLSRCQYQSLALEYSTVAILILYHLSKHSRL